MKKFQVFLAQGLGIGWAPFAPGTFGSVLGVGWFAVLVATGSLPFYLLGTGAMIAASVYLCGVAERELGKTDPGSVVLDEICALPVCFLAWVLILMRTQGHFPQLSDFFSGRALWLTAGVYAAFRFFDIAKPWPVDGSQDLPGGWGITVDDVLAGIYVSLVSLLVWFGWTATH